MHPDVTTSRSRLPVIEFGRDLATESVDYDDSCDNDCSSAKNREEEEETKITSMFVKLLFLFVWLFISSFFWHNKIKKKNESVSLSSALLAD